MSGLVVVRLLPAGEERWLPAAGPGPVLRLRLGTAGAEVVAEAARVRPGAASARGAADEHCAVDAGTVAEHRRPACADVLYTVRPRPRGAAVRWLAEMSARYPGCALAAAPVTGGGWLALAGGGRGGGPTPVARAVGPDQPLLASCLHAWLVQGRSLAELAYVRPVRPHSRRRASAGLVSS
ncbi:hypothetical protein FRZ03_34915 [Streptomyces misionensis]|uniref:Uncharacterized protein n=1 Tax=Streptomyces misionensis TaxID=67331 RepID=A0A5C6IR05_9ACTN|nr:hypothetical protein [Streptomyces misionensis]TWV31668.1 hypothetical protein FRZ03_34915 [Streptomyces misionensis]